MDTETDLTNSVRAILKTLRIFHWKQWQGPMSQPKGVSDILGIIDGRMFAIEMKRPGWTPPKQGTKAWIHHKQQSDFLEAIRANGGIAFFAQSVDEVVDGLGLRDRLLF
jgi:penicillin-binding protein-related factor A (putative recombinase)